MSVGIEQFALICGITQFGHVLVILRFGDLVDSQGIGVTGSGKQIDGIVLE